MSSSSAPSQVLGRENLTVGLELEGHVASVFKGKEDPDKNLTRCKFLASPEIRMSKDYYTREANEFISRIVRHIGEIMKSFKLVHFLFEHPTAGTENSETGEFLGERGRYGAYEIYLGKWAIFIDESGDWYGPEAKRPLPMGPDAYGWYAIEIRTEVYSELDLLSNALGEFCPAFTNNYRVSVKCGRGDARTAVHVHIGNPNGDGFTMVQAKRLITLMWIYELAIMRLHAPYKSNHIRYCSLLRKHSFLAGWVDGGAPVPPNEPPEDPQISQADYEIDPEKFKKGLNAHLEREIKPEEVLDVFNANIPSELRLDKALRFIWYAARMDLLVGLTASLFGRRRPGCSLYGLVLNATEIIHQTRKTPLRTIEFRHMHGSFNRDDIMNWVTVVRKLCDIIVDLTDAGFKSLIVRSWRHLNNTDPQILLDEIGLGHLKFKSQEQLASETDTPKDKESHESNFI